MHFGAFLIGENMVDVLYEDNHVIVAYKPAGVLSQADATGDPDMLTLLKDYIKKKYLKEGNVYLGLVHRLDRMTSGVMVFARTSKAALRLSEDIRNHQFYKQYLAVCEGNIENFTRTKLVNYLTKDEANNRSYLDPKGKEAVLYYQVIKQRNGKSLVSVELETGRHHQIRVQMSAIGHPLYGDIKYGAKNQADLALQAYKLSFHHPITHELLTFEQTNYVGIFHLFQ